MPYKIKSRQAEAKAEWYQRNKALTAKRSKAWKKKNRKKVRESARKYAKENANAVRERQRRFERRQTAELTDYYIIQELDKHGIPTKWSRRMPLLIECVRQHYKMIRLQRQILNYGESQIQEGRECPRPD